jgi:hypothetical protein
MSAEMLPRALRRRRRTLAYAAVAAVALVASAWFVTGLFQTNAYVTSGLVESQSPGIYLPEVYFEVNYTGLGDGSFAYTVAYNTTGGNVQEQSASILVSHGYPFLYTLFESWPANGTLYVTIHVYGNPTPSGREQIYQRTVYLTSADGG